MALDSLYCAVVPLRNCSLMFMFTLQTDHKTSCMRLYVGLSVCHWLLV